MTSATIVVLPGEDDTPQTALRSVAVGQFLHRLTTISRGPARLITRTDSGDGLTAVAGAAVITGDDELVRYVPTRAARQRVACGADGEWPQAVAARHRKLVHRSQGALFQFPVDGGGELEAFVTDWTGLPGACALAVHPAHPLSAGLPEGRTAEFTGRFCRHPLTGDLLPIWTAQWVKPEFGTGAVLVNPAHSLVDLEFARETGLPIRFALEPAGHGGLNDGWLTPPVIRTGQAVRSGIADGLPALEARSAYLDAVSQRGLAEKYEALGLGSFVIATDAESGVEIGWDPVRRTVAGPGGSAAHRSRKVAISPVAEVGTGGDLIVVVPSTRVETDLLALRLLLAEPALCRGDQSAPTVIVVGQTLPIKESAAEDVVRLALLVSAGPLDSLALKSQHVEPCERFLKAHENLPPVAAGDPTDAATAEVAKAAAQVKALLLRHDAKQAFIQLYRLQKSLVKSDSGGVADLRVYHVLAHVVAGTDVPEDAATIWASR
jgi:hypothetical protein